MDAAQNDSPSLFSKIFDYANKSKFYARAPILKAACDSSAFTCEEIIELASIGASVLGSRRWTDTILAFAQGRANKGCISDPANAKSVIDSFDEKWRRQWSFYAMDDVYEMNHARLTQMFVTDNDVLKPAKCLAPPPMRLQTGLRTDEDMEKLVRDLHRVMMLQSPFFIPGSLLAEKFTSWLKQIRADGEQFSGAQLVTLVKALPAGFGLAPAVCALLEHLEQYVTGVTCKEVNAIQGRMATLFRDQAYRMAGLRALKSNIIDGQNKAAIVADLFIQGTGINAAASTEEVLRDVIVGPSPKNNPIFGVVKGNPVIFVVDESDPMDVHLTLGDDIFTRRKFCHNQLEMVLKGLPNRTYFNVIQYDSSAVRIFQKPMLVSKTSIEVAMNKVSSTWRDDYQPGQDPVEWLRRLQGFGLKFKHQFNGSTTNSMEALQLAYASAELPSHQTVHGQHTAKKSRIPRRVAAQDSLEFAAENLRRKIQKVAAGGLPQIYFLTSGRPDGGASQVLDKIDEFDNGRNIPVNSIAFMNVSADHLTKQFAKDLASKTGGFFRSIEQA